MVQVNLGDKPIEGQNKVWVVEDAYDGAISNISDITKEIKYDSRGKKKEELKDEDYEEKFVFTWKVSITGQEIHTLSAKGREVKTLQKGITEEIELPMFLTPKVRKGSGTYQNSKLYDVLEKANLLIEFAAAWDLIEPMEAKLQNEKFIDFLKDHLLNKKARVNVKTVREGTPERYSHVKEVMRFI